MAGEYVRQVRKRKSYVLEVLWLCCGKGRGLGYAYKDIDAISILTLTWRDDMHAASRGIQTKYYH